MQTRTHYCTYYGQFRVKDQMVIRIKLEHVYGTRIVVLFIIDRLQTKEADSPQTTALIKTVQSAADR